MTVSALSVASFSRCCQCFQSPDHAVSRRALRCPLSLKVWRLPVPARLTVEPRTATSRNWLCRTDPHRTETFEELIQSDLRSRIEFVVTRKDHKQKQSVSVTDVEVNLILCAP
jgi:hypothetical protein